MCLMTRLTGERRSTGRVPRRTLYLLDVAVRVLKTVKRRGIGLLKIPGVSSPPRRGCTEATPRPGRRRKTRT